MIAIIPYMYYPIHSMHVRQHLLPAKLSKCLLLPFSFCSQCNLRQQCEFYTYSLVNACKMLGLKFHDHSYSNSSHPNTTVVITAAIVIMDLVTTGMQFFFCGFQPNCGRSHDSNINNNFSTMQTVILTLNPKL